MSKVKRTSGRRVASVVDVHSEAIVALAFHGLFADALQDQRGWYATELHRPFPLDPRGLGWRAGDEQWANDSGK